MRELTIDVAFDLICPWCWIGKRQLARALEILLAQNPDVRPSVRWAGQVLLPQVPDQGWPFREFYEKRLGGPRAVAQRQAQVRAAGEAVGLRFDFERIQTMPSTRLAHHLVTQAEALYGAEKASCLIDALFEAYFQQGRDIGHMSVLDDIAPAVLAQSAATVLAHAVTQVTGCVERASPVQGVPHFVIQGRVSLEGAVHHEVLLKALQRALVSLEDVDDGPAARRA